jgi:hypothetical protein
MLEGEGALEVEQVHPSLEVLEFEEGSHQCNGR